MPVSFAPANHVANATSYPQRLANIPPANLLQIACPNQWKKSDEILQSSFSVRDNDNALVVPRSNGFVGTVIQAYSRHHALLVRPDDVWLAILTQFNFFVNGNTELLRSHFVRHDGKKRLVISAVGSRYTVDFGHMARKMTQLIHENIVDPTFCEWALPDFSTTTITDTTVGAVVTMAAMKSYFTFQMRLLCGIPRVTLEGDKRDWERILARLEKLKDYGVETIAWYHLLFPVISRFVKAFDDPNGQANIEFWQKIAHHEHHGSGPTFLSGWITAFCVFDEDGHWLGNPINPNLDSLSMDLLHSLSAQEFWLTISHHSTSETPCETPYLTLDNTRYHTIDSQKTPNGYAEVDVDLDDNGMLLRTVLTAGLVGWCISSSGDKTLSLTGENDTIRPAAGWWIFTLKDKCRDI